MKNRDIEQMRSEDRFYGEQQKSGKPKREQKVKNRVNYSRFSAHDLAEMEDTDDFE